MEKTGQGLTVRGSSGSLLMNGFEYDVLQFHIHCPSEHAVDGSLFARDMHLVRRKKGASDLNGLLVIGIMYDMGQAIDLLSRMGLPSGAP
jgi:carbonic anhydrase